MTATTSELRIPADPDFILVAKRATAGFASVAGFDVDAVDDVVIAVAQACQNAIACCARAVGQGRAQLRLSFVVDDACLQVNLRTAPLPRVAASAEGALLEAARARQAMAEQLAAQQLEAQRRAAEEEAATELALRVMGLFVDDYGYRVDQRTGGLRVRLTKYRGS